MTTPKQTNTITYKPFSAGPPSYIIQELYKYSGLLMYLRKKSEQEFNPKLLYPTITEYQSKIIIQLSNNGNLDSFDHENITIDTKYSKYIPYNNALFSQFLYIDPPCLNIKINGSLNKDIEIQIDGESINNSIDVYTNKILITPYINICLDKDSSASIALSIYNFDYDKIILPINGSIHLGAGSDLSFLSNMNSRLTGLISEINFIVNLNERSTLSHYYFQKEAYISRNNTEVNMNGEYAEANLYGLSVVSGKSEVDNHSNIQHIKPNCTSNQLYKTVVQDKAKSIFNGRILVEEDSQKTLAYQTNKSLVLSPEAKVRTKPQLEIYADDVKCSHGATIGQIDDKALFFLQCRGIPIDDAKRLLINSFTNEIFEQVKSERFRELIQGE